MWVFGRMLAIIGSLTIWNSWQFLEKRLRIVYNSYKHLLKHSISPTLITTVIAAEDHRFYNHSGADPIAILRAVYNLVARSKWEGASTIEQQLVRTLTMRYEISFFRKIREILLACMVYRVMPKSDIPGVYLSIAYFGWRMNGLLEACNHLGYDLNKITLEQSASLISRLKYPEPQKPSPYRLAQIFLRKNYIIKILGKINLSRRRAE